jgi:hypothetical protein
VLELVHQRVEGGFGSVLVGNLKCPKAAYLLSISWNGFPPGRPMVTEANVSVSRWRKGSSFSSLRTTVMACS